VDGLKVGDDDSQRMTLRVKQGKGHKDRYEMLSPVLLERLRLWWRFARTQGKMRSAGWLFPGLNAIESLLVAKKSGCAEKRDRCRYGHRSRSGSH
jgi:integrase